MKTNFMLNTTVQQRQSGTINRIALLNMVDFGSNLKELRLKHKMTQKELADKIGVTKSVVSYYELQERSPSPEILIKLSRIFHVTTDYLLGIEHTHTTDVSNLSSEQLTVIEQLIKLFESDDKIKESTSFSMRQTPLFFNCVINAIVELMRLRCRNIREVKRRQQRL